MNTDTSPMNTTTSHYLKHQFLIAMPQLDDPNFAHTLIYLIEHNAQGAMGLVINRPNGLSLADVLEQLNPERSAPSFCQSLPIFSGGPVQTERGFVLHPAQDSFQATLQLGELSLTTSQDVLFAIADGQGPEQYFIALGYAGWDAGQLETELLNNTWLTCPANEQILFELPYDQRLTAAAAQLGIDLNLLVANAGHA